MDNDNYEVSGIKNSLSTTASSKLESNGPAVESPTKSRYGRLQKPKISEDFYNIDLILDAPSPAVEVSTCIQKSSSRTANKSYTSLTSSGKATSSLLSSISPSTNDKFSSRKFTNDKSPPARKFFKRESASAQAKKEDLELEDVSKVLKIISTKPTDSIQDNIKSTPKSALKTYGNRKKSLNKAALVESFGLPDTPIFPLDSSNLALPEPTLDVAPTNLDTQYVDKQLLNVPWPLDDISTETNFKSKFSVIEPQPSTSSLNRIDFIKVSPVKFNQNTGNSSRKNFSTKIIEQSSVKVTPTKNTSKVEKTRTSSVLRTKNREQKSVKKEKKNSSENSKKTSKSLTEDLRVSKHKEPKVKRNSISKRKHVAVESNEVCFKGFPIGNYSEFGKRTLCIIKNLEASIIAITNSRIVKDSINAKSRNELKCASTSTKDNFQFDSKTKDVTSCRDSKSNKLTSSDRSKEISTKNGAVKQQLLESSEDSQIEKDSLQKNFNVPNATDRNSQRLQKTTNNSDKIDKDVSVLTKESDQQPDDKTKRRKSLKYQETELKLADTDTSKRHKKEESQLQPPKNIEGELEKPLKEISEDTVQEKLILDSSVSSRVPEKSCLSTYNIRESKRLSLKSKSLDRQNLTFNQASTTETTDVNNLNSNNKTYSSSSTGLLGCQKPTENASNEQISDSPNPSVAAESAEQDSSLTEVKRRSIRRRKDIARDSINEQPEATASSLNSSADEDLLLESDSTQDYSENIYVIASFLNSSIREKPLSKELPQEKEDVEMIPTVKRPELNENLSNSEDVSEVLVKNKRKPLRKRKEPVQDTKRETEELMVSSINFSLDDEDLLENNKNASPRNRKEAVQDSMEEAVDLNTALDTKDSPANDAKKLLLKRKEIVQTSTGETSNLNVSFIDDEDEKKTIRRKEEVVQGSKDEIEEVNTLSTEVEILQTNDKKKSLRRRKELFHDSKIEKNELITNLGKKNDTVQGFKDGKLLNSNVEDKDLSVTEKRTSRRKSKESMKGFSSSSIEEDNKNKDLSVNDKKKSSRGKKDLLLDFKAKESSTVSFLSKSIGSIDDDLRLINSTRKLLTNEENEDATTSLISLNSSVNSADNDTPASSPRKSLRNQKETSDSAPEKSTTNAFKKILPKLKENEPETTLNKSGSSSLENKKRLKRSRKQKSFAEFLSEVKPNDEAVDTGERSNFINRKKSRIQKFQVETLLSEIVPTTTDLNKLETFINKPEDELSEIETNDETVELEETPTAPKKIKLGRPRKRSAEEFSDEISNKNLVKDERTPNTSNKKKLGRPRKKPAEELSEVESNGEVEETPNTPKNRKMGRPRKKPVEELSELETNDETEETANKKKLGRPRKKLIEELSEVESNDEAEETLNAANMRKLGRPKKKSVGEPSEVESNDEAEETSNTANIRKLGRPKKKSVEEPSEMESIDEAEETPNAADKRKLGRPKKKPVQDPSEVELNYEPEETPNATNKRKLGRPRKKPVEELSEVETNDEADDANKTPNIANKIKLGRPRKQQPMEGEAVDVEETQNVIKKKMGRPRKSIVIKESEVEKVDLKTCNVIENVLEKRKTLKTSQKERPEVKTNKKLTQELSTIPQTRKKNFELFGSKKENLSPKKGTYNVIADQDSIKRHFKSQIIDDDTTVKSESEKDEQKYLTEDYGSDVEINESGVIIDNSNALVNSASEVDLTSTIVEEESLNEKCEPPNMEGETKELDEGSKLANLEDNIKRENVKYELGDLIWAKIGQYPYWPCMIFDEPLTGQYKMIVGTVKQKVCYHMRFFGDEGRRCWASVSAIIPYTDKDDIKNLTETYKFNSKVYRKYTVKPYLLDRLQTAIEEVESLKSSTVEERFDFFYNMFTEKAERKAKLKEEEKNKLALREKEENFKKIKEAVMDSPITIKSDTSKQSSRASSPIKTKRVKLSQSQESIENEDGISIPNEKTDTLEELNNSWQLPNSHITNLLTEVNSETSSSDSDSISKSSSSISLSDSFKVEIIRYKNCNIFKGISRDRVCQVCRDTGEILKCKGPCGGLFHLACSKMTSLEVKQEKIDEDFKKGEEPTVSVDAIDSRGDVEIIEIDSDSDSSEYSHMLTTEVNVMSKEEFKRLSLPEKIDIKMQELMETVQKKTKYANSHTDEASMEEDNSDEDENASGLIIQHVTADSIIFASPEDSQKIKKAKVSAKQKPVAAEEFVSITSSVSEDSVSEIKDFKCNYCSEGLDPPCHICHKQISDKNETILQKCSLRVCGKFYHPRCLKKLWPQTQWSFISTAKHKNSDKQLDTFVCPMHMCHTCVSENPRASYSRCLSSKVVRCLLCPATYHSNNYCVPAGTDILSNSDVVCPRHFANNDKNSITHTVNTPWCFVCSKGGELICCETCPTSVHSDCLHINLLDDDTFVCEDCEAGRFPLYDEVVWVKLGRYRWWPAIIIFPSEVPDTVNNIFHTKGQFVVKFFGTHDYFWVSKGRVFLFQEGDRGCPKSSKSRVDVIFNKSIEEASRVHEFKKLFKLNQAAEIKTNDKPPPFIKIKINRPVGNVRQVDANVSNTTPCECSPTQPNPCGPDSYCINRLLWTECDPSICPAKDKCNNQRFEKRQYPLLVPHKTKSRGWGLKTLSSISKGDFVIEYVGEVIDEQEYQRRISRMHEQKDENYYFLTIDPNRIIDAGPKGNLARFMNHCCLPNCETQKWTVNGDTRVGLFALQDIPEGSELTFNYNLECVGTEKKICNCGASNCSGFIGVKAKQDESQKKYKKSYSKKKKPLPLHQIPKNEGPCFVCKESGDVGACHNKICTKFYHLKCVNLEFWPEGKWVCPWHNCNVCTKRTIRCCVKCINSYCPVHSEANIRYDKLLGYVCSEHDQTKESPEMETPIIIKSNSSSTLTTEETDITSTTSEEVVTSLSDLLSIDSVESMMTIDSVTCTPPQTIHNLLEDGKKVEKKVKSPMIKRRKNRNSSAGEDPKSKKVKLDSPALSPSKNKPEPNSVSTVSISLQNEIKLSSTVPLRHLRTTRSSPQVNVEVERFLKHQNEVEKDLPFRKRSRLRYENDNDL